jgi:HSP20 family protein
MEGTKMTLVRFDPIRDLVGIQERLSRLMADSQRTTDDGYGAWLPPVDIFEKGDDLLIRAEVPGVDKDDIDIRVENGVLQIRGERRPNAEVQEGNAYRLERAYGRFNRSFTLPTTVDASRIAAKYKDGVLELSIPKAESAKPKKVQIETV